MFIGRIKPHHWSDVVDGINRLLDVASSGEGDLVRSSLAALVPECTFARPHANGKKTAPRGERALTGPHDLPLDLPALSATRN